MMKTARKVSKYGVFSGPYFAVFSQNTSKYGSEKNSVFEQFSRSGIIFWFTTDNNDFAMNFSKSYMRR